ncbi:hypothetical protein [Vitiosangium sp. GDMCC 1.1324]|uniref:hypothetical protein n=1 Tax=Vitiosangium sp. (strain GDMCC 1.1324) TaxID=2138576 RepID=UPI000D38FA67|nr:hypothetical protein [Vitiosangium sp. GDMCC 1.1324]PTL80218.1 hypothetical protein DAT35_29920 [Vitiosangium sp. GDMCC 1.1324]
MVRSRIQLAAALAVFFAGSAAMAQYTRSAGQNAPSAVMKQEYVDEKGQRQVREVEVKAAADSFGNAAGNQHDLAVDGAFDGQTVAVLHLYTGEGFDFALPKKALAEKGFSVYRWMNQPPSPEVLEEKLKQACQLWIISDARRLLTEKHLEVIKRFFDSGKGVYIWGDNEPYYADANAVARKLLDVGMSGNVLGDKVVGLQKAPGQKGLLPRHLLTTGLEYIYEGITIATIQPNQSLTPLIYGSAGNLVTAIYDRNGKRAILDGGFTRLFLKWDTAGTGRYVKNAAAWLVNVERFGDAVVSSQLREGGTKSPQ